MFSFFFSRVSFSSSLPSFCLLSSFSFPFLVSRYHPSLPFPCLVFSPYRASFLTQTCHEFPPAFRPMRSHTRPSPAQILLRWVRRRVLHRVPSAGESSRSLSFSSAFSISFLLSTAYPYYLILRSSNTFFTQSLLSLFPSFPLGATCTELGMHGSARKTFVVTDTFADE